MGATDFRSGGEGLRAATFQVNLNKSARIYGTLTNRAVTIITTLVFILQWLSQGSGGDVGMAVFTVQVFPKIRKKSITGRLKVQQIVFS